MIFGIKGVSFEKYKKTIDEYHDKFFSGPKSVPGTLDPKIEKEFKLIIKQYNRHILNSNNPELKKMIERINKTAGDWGKFDKVFRDHIKYDIDRINTLMRSYKNNKNITEFNVLRTYRDAYSLLTSAKYIATFKKAFEEAKKNKGKEPFMATSMMIIAYSVLCITIAYYSLYLMYEMIGDVDPGVEMKLHDKQIENRIIDISSRFSGFITSVGYSMIGLVEYLNSLKNPLKDIVDSIEVEKKARKNLTEGKESFYDEFTTHDGLMGKYVKGEESVILIIVGAIVGTIALFGLLRFSLYYIGKIKVDIIGYITVENEMLKVNISELQEKLVDAQAKGDKKEIERLEKIIAKQQAWSDRFSGWISKAVGDSYKEASEAKDEYDNDTKQIESDEETSDDDYEVIL